MWRLLVLILAAFIALIAGRVATAQKTAFTADGAWVYLFTRQRSGPGGEALGAYHGAELPYVFDTHDPWLPTEESDRRLTGELLRIWTRFAETGMPAPAQGNTWPTFNAARPTVVELGDRIGVIDSRDDDLCDVLGPAKHLPGNDHE